MTLLAFIGGLMIGLILGSVGLVYLLYRGLMEYW